MSKEYEEMSDSRIAMCVAMRLEGVDYDGSGEPKFAVDCFSETKGTHCRVAFVGDGGEYTSFDPCNNPSDAWPIIVENGISIQHGELVGVSPNWMATYWKTNGKVYPVCIETINKNPLRAAMICFLKMKDNEQ